jgi:lipopolysaccharide/colanic/teichoic acid biosynthesis glycosyltransferase
VSSAVADLGARPFGRVHLHVEDGLHLKGSPAPRRERYRAKPAAQLPDRHWHDNALPSGEFMAAVQREKRRAERSKAPLSLVLYRVDEVFAQDPLHIEQLVETLHRCKREIDVLGHVSNDTIAVLCPDTDDNGTAGFIRKLESLVENLPVKAIAATYPDHIFESLSKGKATEAAFEPFLVASGASPSAGQYRLKRSLDIVGALIALCILGPLMLIVAISIALTSPGPVIFKQPRLGKGGVPFTFYKFRSMVVNVDDRIHREYMANLIRAGHGEPPADGKPATYKMKADPRVTRIGKIIRMTSIDELPQLFNVLKGDMSMVGPRPPIPYEATHYEPWHLRRILTGKPGITGLWQVEGRSRVTFSEMVRMDLRYIRDCSLSLDLKILLKTFAVVLRCDGAR